MTVAMLAPLPDSTWPTPTILTWLGIASASADDDDHAYWKAVSLLQQRDVNEIWDALMPLCEREDPHARRIVPDVLRALGGTPQPRREATIALFRRMLSRERSPLVIMSIGLAFVDIDHPASVELMVPYRDHPESEVRRSVVHALLGRREPAAIEALIHLSRDEVNHIREWALFGLGSQLGEPGDPDFVDTPAIREALAAGLADPDEAARGEAAVGLSIRKDPRAIPVIRAALEQGAKVDMFARAAEVFGDADLGVLCEHWFQEHGSR